MAHKSHNMSNIRFSSFVRLFPSARLCENLPMDSIGSYQKTMKKLLALVSEPISDDNFKMERPNSELRANNTRLFGFLFLHFCGLIIGLLLFAICLNTRNTNILKIKKQENTNIICILIYLPTNPKLVCFVYLSILVLILHYLKMCLNALQYYSA